MPTFFDCDVMLGQTVVPPEAPLQTRDGLVGEMDRYGIASALVFHYAAAFGPEAASRMNERTLAVVQGEPRLTPCAALAPWMSKIDEPLQAQVEGFGPAGFRAVRIVAGYGPTADPITLTMSGLDDVFAELEQHRLVLFLPADHLMVRDDPVLFYDFEQIDTVCRTFPRLAVVLLRPHYRAQATFVSLMRRRPNLYISTTLLALHGQLESLAAMVGAERLLFGSNMPYRDASVPCGNLAYSALSAEEKELVAGGNLRRLLKGEQ